MYLYFRKIKLYLDVLSASVINYMYTLTLCIYLSISSVINYMYTLTLCIYLSISSVINYMYTLTTYTVYISQYIFCNKLHVHTYTVYISQYITMKILATGRWFSSGTPVSSTNKTDCHDIIEILLKVALSTLTLITLQ